MLKNEAIRKIATEHPDLWARMQTGQLSYREAKKRAGLTTPAPRIEQQPHNIEVGTVFVSRWGYDQTNIDFYEVVAITPKTLQLRPIKATRTDGEGPYTHNVLPLPGEYTGDVIRRRIAAGSRNAVAINSFEYASPWEGRTETATSYA